MTRGPNPVPPSITSLPIVGPWASRLGQIHQIFATPCTQNPEIWVYAAWQALPRLVFLVTKPFLIATEWHARTGRSHRPLKGIAAMLDEVTPKAPILESPGWAAFQIPIDFALKAEWYFMIVDRTLEFFVNWSSLAYLYNGCQFPSDFTCEGSLLFGGGLVIGTDQPKLVGPFQFNGSDGPFIGASIGVPPGQTAVPHYSFNFTPQRFLTIPACSNLTVQMIDSYNGAVVTSSTWSGMKAGVPNGGSNATDVDTLNQHGHEYFLMLTGDGAATNFTCDFGIQSFTTGTKGLLFDP